MSERIIIENRIRRKESEIQTLEKKLSAARVYVQALKDIRRAIDEGSDDSSSGGTPLRKGSAMSRARDVILELGTPVHIDTLLQHLGRERTRENKASLAGSLAAYVRRNEVFTRPAPNTYGLIELEHFEEKQLPEEPPHEFGDASSSSFDDSIPF